MTSKSAEMNVDDPASPPSQSGDGNRYQLRWGLSLDLQYMKSPHGILLAAMTILSLIACICGAAGRSNPGCNYNYGSAYDFFSFVAGSALLTGILNYILYIFTFYDRLVLKFVPWNWVWMIWSGVWAFFYLAGSAAVAAKACGQPGNTAAAIFGFVTMGTLGALGFLTYRQFREELADRAGTGPQSSSSPPEYSAEKTMEQY